METFVADLTKLVGIFGLAFFYFWPAIPTGLALGLSPIAVIGATALSYACGVAVVALFGARVRDLILTRLKRNQTVNTEGRLYRVWERYGLLGLGLAAPMTIGAQLGAALGLTLNAKPRPLFFAMSFGALVWSIALTVITMMGIITFQVTR
jgi:hypothetical protein